MLEAFKINLLPSVFDKARKIQENCFELLRKDKLKAEFQVNPLNDSVALI